MPVHIAWEDERKRIIRYSPDESWTWDEFFAAKERANDLMDTVSHKLGVIIDAPPTAVLPPNLLANARKALRNKHPNTVVIVIVAARPLIRTMIHTIRGIARLSSTRVELADNLDEARAIINVRLRSYDTSPTLSNH